MCCTLEMVAIVGHIRLVTALAHRMHIRSIEQVNRYNRITKSVGGISQEMPRRFYRLQMDFNELPAAVYALHLAVGGNYMIVQPSSWTFVLAIPISANV